MGEAKRRQQQEHPLDCQAVELVGAALRKLAGAASSHLGGDCYLHAVLGQKLLESKGIRSEIAAGYAAWRTGQSDGSVVSHSQKSAGYLPPGAQGFAYHAWLVVGCHVVDFTTYQLPRKAAELDAADGGHTEMDWCPELLIAHRSSIRSYNQVAQGNTGLYYYERHLGVEARLAATFTLDPEDLRLAHLILATPDIVVVGPNHVPANPIAG